MVCPAFGMHVWLPQVLHRRDETGESSEANPTLLGWPVLVYYSLSLKFLLLESFALTLKMELERFSETSEWGGGSEYDLIA